MEESEGKVEEVEKRKTEIRSSASSLTQDASSVSFKFQNKVKHSNYRSASSGKCLGRPRTAQKKHRVVYPCKFASWRRHISSLNREEVPKEVKEITTEIDNNDKLCENRTLTNVYSTSEQNPTAGASGDVQTITTFVVGSNRMKHNKRSAMKQAPPPVRRPPPPPPPPSPQRKISPRRSQEASLGQMIAALNAEAKLFEAVVPESLKSLSVERHLIRKITRCVNTSKQFLQELTTSAERENALRNCSLGGSDGTAETVGAIAPGRRAFWFSGRAATCSNVAPGRSTRAGKIREAATPGEARGSRGTKPAGNGGNSGDPKVSAAKGNSLEIKTGASENTTARGGTLRKPAPRCDQNEQRAQPKHKVKNCKVALGEWKAGTAGTANAGGAACTAARDESYVRWANRTRPCGKPANYALCHKLHGAEGQNTPHLKTSKELADKKFPVGGVGGGALAGARRGASLVASVAVRRPAGRPAERPAGAGSYSDLKKQRPPSPTEKVCFACGRWRNCPDNRSHLGGGQGCDANAGEVEIAVETPPPRPPQLPAQSAQTASRATQTPSLIRALAEAAAAGATAADCIQQLLVPLLCDPSAACQLSTSQVVLRVGAATAEKGTATGHEEVDTPESTSAPAAFHTDTLSVQTATQDAYRHLVPPRS